MISIPAAQARAKLHQLLDEAAESHEPIQIRGRRSNAVLIPEPDWRSIQEAIHLKTVTQASHRPFLMRGNAL